MSVLELLFALLLVCLMVGIGVVGFLVWNLSRSADGHARDVAELKARLQTGGLTQESQAAELRERLTQTQSVVEGLRSAISARQPVEEEARASLKRLESVIAGSSSRGAAGEHAQLMGQVEREVERRVREVSQYIDPATTAPFALAVIPDAAYDVCRGAIVNAHSRHVMVVGYAMALPYLLTLYQLHLQFARSVDMEKLQSGLIDIERQVDVLEGILENKVQRSLTVLQNAYTEGKQATAKIRASAQAVQITESSGETVSTDSPGAGDQVSTETLRLALVDSVQ